MNAIFYRKYFQPLVDSNKSKRVFHGCFLGYNQCVYGSNWKKLGFHDKLVSKIVSSVGSLTPSKITGIRLIAVKFC